MLLQGAPGTVRDRLTEAVKMLRVGHLMCLLHIGTMPKELTRKNTELFAKEVLPAIKPIYSEYEDPWWPDSLKQGSLHAVGD
ncbi:MAG: hypothetical protein CM1200mP35_09080 [Chloroflexota bacterium]|nr:MAG: hypothetical protein CM1200mP35_09080 [Chloroflexota bacterium]